MLARSQGLCFCPLCRGKCFSAVAIVADCGAVSRVPPAVSPEPGPVAGRVPGDGSGLLSQSKDLRLLTLACGGVGAAGIGSLAPSLAGAMVEKEQRCCVPCCVDRIAIKRHLEEHRVRLEDHRPAVPPSSTHPCGQCGLQPQGLWGAWTRRGPRSRISEV